MNDSTDQRATLETTVDAIEAGYEFLLAYAAQGRHTDRGGGAGDDLRKHLGRMAEALEALPGQAAECLAERSAELRNTGAAFLDALDSDARIAASAVNLVLAQSDIGSQLIDNLNASIHLRAVLTDIFLVDELLKPPPAAGGVLAT